MNKLLAKLPPFALPFVTRSLRGGRGQRYALFSLLGAIGVLLLGLWLALSPGRFAHNIRVDLDLERDEWEWMHAEFMVFAHDPSSELEFERDVERMRAQGIYAFATDEEVYRATWAAHVSALDELMSAASSVNVETPEHERLRDRARVLLDYQRQPDPYDAGGYYYAWSDPSKVARLERILDRAAIPEVRRYRSPLGVGEGMALVGLLAGLALAISVTVVGPLLVGIQQAQEQHENTLAPLTGSGFRPDRLALGLASGPTAMVALFAAPQLLLMLGAMVLAGRPLIGLALLVVLATTSVFVTFAAQLLGHVLGPKRTPGVVALLLSGLFGVSWLAGGSLAAELSDEIAGIAAVLPTVGIVGMLVNSFGMFGVRAEAIADSRLLVTSLAWSLAAIVFAGLTLQVLARKLEGRAGAPLSARATALGAVTSMVLINLAIPDLRGHEQNLRVYFGLAGLSVPFTLLFMGRIAIGEEPARLRRIPVPRLLGEFAAWFVAHALITTALFQLDLDVLHPIAIAWLAWCVGVLGLMAIRAVALPVELATHLLLGACGIGLIVGFVQAALWGLDEARSVEMVFFMFGASPVAGLIQIAATLAIPALLLRSLRTGLGGLS
jgi:hypothetical protein